MSKVSFIHYRPTIDGKVSNSGGFTVAFTEVDTGIDYAVCKCSDLDNFNKFVGRTKAEGRLNSNKYRKIIRNITYKEFRDYVYENGEKFLRSPVSNY